MINAKMFGDNWVLWLGINLNSIIPLSKSKLNECYKFKCSRYFPVLRELIETIEGEVTAQGHRGHQWKKQDLNSGFPKPKFTAVTMWLCLLFEMCSEQVADAWLQKRRTQIF